MGPLLQSLYYRPIYCLTHVGLSLATYLEYISTGYPLPVSMVFLLLASGQLIAFNQGYQYSKSIIKEISYINK